MIGRIIYQILVRIGLVIVMIFVFALVIFRLIFGFSLKETGKALVMIAHAIYKLKSDIK